MSRRLWRNAGVPTGRCEGTADHGLAGEVRWREKSLRWDVSSGASSPRRARKEGPWPVQGPEDHPGNSLGRGCVYKNKKQIPHSARSLWGSG